MSLFAPCKISEKFPWASVALRACREVISHPPGCDEILQEVPSELQSSHTAGHSALDGGHRRICSLTSLQQDCAVTFQGAICVCRVPSITLAPSQEQGAAEECPVLLTVTQQRHFHILVGAMCDGRAVTRQGFTARTCWQIIPTGWQMHLELFHELRLFRITRKLVPVFLPVP